MMRENGKKYGNGIAFCNGSKVFDTLCIPYYANDSMFFFSIGLVDIVALCGFFAHRKLLPFNLSCKRIHLYTGRLDQVPFMPVLH